MSDGSAKLTTRSTVLLFPRGLRLEGIDSSLVGGVDVAVRESYGLSTDGFVEAIVLSRVASPEDDGALTNEDPESRTWP